nr:MAG TPA: hypothetical protein [Bacteriophage sp.]DAZ04073.1 MAG TPA: hypothetical protein [Caudoviricetes sp.]
MIAEVGCNNNYLIKFIKWQYFYNVLHYAYLARFLFIKIIIKKYKLTRNIEKYSGLQAFNKVIR